MLAPLASLLLVQASSAALATDRMLRPVADPTQVESLAVRLISPQGVLWQGNVRVTENQGASYSQSFSQATLNACPPNSYDRTEQNSLSFNIYFQNNGNGIRSFRLDSSWQRPAEASGCGERGTRTVQVNQNLAIDHGQTGVVEGDAGFRIEVTRR